MSEALSLLAAFGITFGVRYRLGPVLSRWLGLPTPAALADHPEAFEPAARFAARLLSCSYCVGLYAGAAAWALRYAPPIVTWALAGAAFCWALDEVVTWFDRCRA